MKNFIVKTATFSALLMCVTACAALAGKPAPAEGQFWAMRALHAVPFEIQTLSSQVKDGIRNDEIYFTSERGAGGKPVRIYAYLAGPVEPKGKIPAILMIHGGGGTADKAGAPWMAGVFGAYVLSIDWSGIFPGHERFSHFEAVMDPKLANQPTYVAPDLSDAGMTHIGRACLRGIDLLLAQKEADPRHVLVMGGSWGGFLSLLTAGLDPRITTASGAFGGGAFEGAGSLCARDLYKAGVSPAQRAFWLEHFDPIRVVGNIRRPVMYMTASNDRFFALACDVKTFEALPRGSVFAIGPNSDHTLGSGIDDNWMHWFKTELGREPAWETLSDFTFDGRQASWTVQGPSPTAQSVLVFAPGHEDWPGRCWLEFAARGDGSRFRVTLPAWAQGVEGDGYVLSTDRLGRVTCTVPVHVRGKSLAEFSSGRPEPGLIDDLADGVGRWRAALYIPGQTVAWRKSAAGQAPALELSRQDGKAGDLGLLTNAIALAAGKLGAQGRLSFTIEAPAGGGKLKVSLVEHANLADEKVFSVESPLKNAAGWQKIELPLAQFVLNGQSPDWGKVNELRLDLKAPEKAKYAFTGFRIQ